MTSLVGVELKRTEWSSIREAAGTSSGVPDAVRLLLDAATAADARAAYWQLENHVRRTARRGG